MNLLRLTAFTLALSVLSPLYLYAESPSFTYSPSYAIGFGLDVSSGTFGTGATSTYVTAPLIIDWFPTGRIDLELTVPFLYQRTTNTGHAVLGTNISSAAKSVASGSMMGSGGNAGGGGGGMFAGDYGLGDMTVTGGYTLLTDSDSSPLVRPTVYIKFPTADESKGLGTGKFDLGAGIAVSKWLGNWQPFAEGRYVFQGASRDETGALDFFTADAGFAYSWSERFVTSAYTRVGSALFDGMSAPLEARVKTVWRFGDKMYSELYALKGFSDGSPDYGGGISLFREF